MKKRYVLTALAAAAALLLGSCEMALGSRDEGTISLYLGSGPSARALSDAPFDGLPVFSSVTVTVSGSGMATASQTVPGDASQVTIQVPAGPSRKVQVYAVADWDATGQLYGATLPTLAKAYGGTAAVDVAGGQTVNVSMDMDVVETKIMLPDYYYGSWSSADSVTSAPENYDWSYYGEYFQFDRYGRLLTMDGEVGLTIYTEPYYSSSPGTTAYGGPFAYYRPESAVYVASGGSYLAYIDSDFFETLISLDYGFETIDGIAVDEDGYVYVAGYDVVAKYKVDLVQGTATRVRYATYQSLGLGYWGTYIGQNEEIVPYFYTINVQDMTFKDGRLFILASEINAYDYMTGTDAVSRGKVVEVRPVDLSKREEYGWTNDNIPPGDTTTRLYGPRRFIALAPRKLIFADDGFWWNGSATMGNNLENRNGIGVLDLDTGQLTRTEISGVEFFESFSNLTIY